MAAGKVASPRSEPGSPNPTEVQLQPSGLAESCWLPGPLGLETALSLQADEETGPGEAPATWTKASCPWAVHSLLMCPPVGILLLRLHRSEICSCLGPALVPPPPCQQTWCPHLPTSCWSGCSWQFLLGDGAPSFQGSGPSQAGQRPAWVRVGGRGGPRSSGHWRYQCHFCPKTNIIKSIYMRLQGEMQLDKAHSSLLISCCLC